MPFSEREHAFTSVYLRTYVCILFRISEIATMKSIDIHRFFEMKDLFG